VFPATGLLRPWGSAAAVLSAFMPPAPKLVSGFVPPPDPESIIFGRLGVLL